MSEYPASQALLRTLPRLMARVRAGEDVEYATRPATQPHLKQAAAHSVERVLSGARRQRPTSEERTKEIQRRRKWAGGGNMPEDVRAHYTEAERAALSVIAEQCKRKGYCDLCLDEIARLAGVGRTSVQNAIRKARAKDRAHISVRERRPQKGVLSLTNIIKIIGRTWLSWIQRALGFKREGGFKHLSTTETGVKNSLFNRGERPKSAFEREGADRHQYQSQRLRSGLASGVASFWRSRE